MGIGHIETRGIGHRGSMGTGHRGTIGNGHSGLWALVIGIMGIGHRENGHWS